MTITELCKSAHENAVNKGFYENPGSIDEHLMLIISELSEALEADRKDKHCKIDITKEPSVMSKTDFE